LRENITSAIKNTSHKNYYQKANLSTIKESIVWCRFSLQSTPLFTRLKSLSESEKGRSGFGKKDMK